ncbi:Gfo/Idh/MocA family oxidoreductase [Ferrimonas sp. YFM]|uniref:Gfo/Idh/MocA family protein n=1 Tax=Ferrimonas sp. YFM TaxID=3028878 RepID=UPI00257321E6|nr:Gfo/Idh/MocA family oxidoreductase [Ferrimonas sp. YFM]BDY04401.1 oxidoreductase [Ferrimonas sp. YFM]
MSTPLRWGILGTSFISGVMADAIAAEGQTRIQAVAGRHPERLAQFADQYGIEQRYQDFDALIADPEVDIVYIALPNHLHHDYVVKAAEAGKAILCEKSLSVDMAGTEAALGAVADAGVFFAEGLMYLNHPVIARAVELVREGGLGDLRAIHASYSAAISQFVNPGSKGTLYNLGCYPASLAHLMLQQVGLTNPFDGAQIQALGRRGEDGNICESAASLRLRNGVAMQLHSAEDYGLDWQFTLVGSDASLKMVTNPWLPGANNTLQLTPHEQPAQTIEVAAEGDAFLYQVRAVRQALEAGQRQLSRPAAMVQDSREIMALLTRWEAATATVQ